MAVQIIVKVEGVNGSEYNNNNQAFLNCGGNYVETDSTTDTCGLYPELDEEPVLEAIQCEVNSAPSSVASLPSTSHTSGESTSVVSHGAKRVWAIAHYKGLKCDGAVDERSTPLGHWLGGMTASYLKEVLNLNSSAEAEILAQALRSLEFWSFKHDTTGLRLAALVGSFDCTSPGGRAGHMFTHLSEQQATTLLEIFEEEKVSELEEQFWCLVQAERRFENQTDCSPVSPTRTRGEVVSLQELVENLMWVAPETQIELLAKWKEVDQTIGTQLQEICDWLEDMLERLQDAGVDFVAHADDVCLVGTTDGKFGDDEEAVYRGLAIVAQCCREFGM